MKHLLTIVTYNILILSSFISCKSPKDVKQTLEVVNKKEVSFKDSKIEEIPEYFFNKQWVHRPKEDKEDLLYFKPEFKIKYHNLYSNQLFFNNGGTCKYRWLAPNDAHKMKDATWTYIPNKLYILGNENDIIDVYHIHSISDSLLLLKKEGVPSNNIYGKWKLVETKGEDVRYLGYIIDLKENEVIISRADIVPHSYSMSHSLRRIGEPIALNFDVEISKLYPWIASGHYGVIRDTLILEIGDNKVSKFIR